MEERLKFPVWFNADIIVGPGGGDPVDADRFLDLCAQYFPGKQWIMRILSLHKIEPLVLVNQNNSLLTDAQSKLCLKARAENLELMIFQEQH